MEAYLYDEDRWPSGSAGGMVTVDTSLRMKYLILETMPAEQFEWNDEGIVSAFACDLNGIDYSNLQRLNPASNMADYAGKTVLKFAQRTCPESDVYNGTTYLDVFNPKATERFIELTHEQYRKHCGERIGTTIEGIFTDEPHRGGLFSTFGAVSTYACPWALSLPQEYEKMFGGDLTADLPKLFLRENGERVNDVKWKFCELTQSLFLKNFAKPQYDWCTEHDMAYTGHVLHENNLTSQVTMQGSLMRYYEYMHTPGIDLLTENDNAYWVPKQLSSVARQLGQKWLLSEMYGCTGWQFDFENHKAVGRLAGAFRHQPALPAPVVVYDGGRGQARLSGQHLLPVALVEAVQICRGLLLASGRHAESGSACLRRARRQSDRERLESGVRAFVQRAVARCARDRRDGG